MMHRNSKQNDVHMKKNMSFLSTTMIENEKVHPETSAVMSATFLLERPLEIENVKKLISEKFVTYDSRLRSIPIRKHHRLHWKEVPIDLDRHVISVILEDPDDNWLDKFLTEKYKSPMDRQFPLWYFYVVSGLPGGKGALVSTIHHIIGDGISTVILWMQMFDSHTASRDKMHANLRRQIPRSVWSDPLFLGHRLYLFVKGFVVTLTSPFYMADTKTCLKLSKPTDLHVSKRIAFSNPIPLQKITEIKNSVNATVNETFLALLAATIRRFLEKHDPSCLSSSKLRIHGVIPLSARTPTDLSLGNRFVFYPLEVPVSETDPFGMLMESQRYSHDMKLSPEPAIFMFVQQLATKYLPTSWVLGFQQIILDKFTFAFTNVPGASEPQSLLGVKVENLVGCVSSPFGSLMMLSSYSDTITLSVCADPEILPDPKEIVRYFEEEVDHFLRVTATSTPKIRSYTKEYAIETLMILIAILLLWFLVM